MKFNHGICYKQTKVYKLTRRFSSSK